MFEFFYNFLGLNQTIFIFINKTTNISILPYIFQIVSWCFNVINFVIIYIICCVYLYIKLKAIQRLDQRKVTFYYIYDKIVMIGIIYMIFVFTYILLKFSINLPRPFCSLPSKSFITIANTNLERCLSSFPSAHVGLAFLISYFIWPFVTLWQKCVSIFIILLVAISRITLAMHYPADIIYSLFITIVIILFSKIIFKIFSNNLIKSIGDFIGKFIIFT